MTAPQKSFETDLREQPETVARLLAQGREAAEAIAAAVRGRHPPFALLAARGTSDNAARYGQYVFGIRNGLVVSLAAPSIVTQYSASMRLGDGLVLGLSQSGQSPDVVAVIAEGRRQGAVTVAITNDPQSPLANAAEWVLPLFAGTERAVAATKTYTAEVMALAMISAGLRDDGAWADLAHVPDQVAKAIALCSDCPAGALRFQKDGRLVVVGRGYNLCTVFEIALKIKETCGLMAEAYSSADFLHGPVALLDRGMPVLIIAPAARTFEDLDAVVSLAHERGARVIALSDSEKLLSAAEVALPMPPGIPEWVSPLVAVVPGQLWAQALAEARGLTPDAPRGLSKVTRTR